MGVKDPLYRVGPNKLSWTDANLVYDRLAGGKQQFQMFVSWHAFLY